MSENTVAGLSTEEFQRLQTSLLELRSANYNLTEQGARKDREISNLEQKITKLEDELQKFIKGKRAKTGELSDNAETDILRQKLAVQEEEFRLQQATLMGELQRVIAQQEELEQEVRDLKNFQPQPTAESAASESEILRREDDYERQLAELRKDAEMKNREFAEARKREAEQFVQAKTGSFQKELFDLKDQLRRAQSNYASLAEEKSLQLEEFKKSLDNMVQKKEVEFRAVLDELNSCKRQLETVNVEKASLEIPLKQAQGQVIKLTEQNEYFQIQLQETHSANDCLSSQLQETRREVARMQQQLEEANELASKRKSLVDEMNVHLETLKEEFQKKQQDLLDNHALELENLNERLKQALERNEESGNLEQKILLLESLLQTAEDRSSQLEARVEELNCSLQSYESDHGKELDAQLAETKRQEGEAQTKLEALKEEYEVQLTVLNTERDERLKLVQHMMQEIKDKEDAVKAVERKYQSVVKDLKRQLQTEKKRYDRLQEKISTQQDTASAAAAVESAAGRNRSSPGNTSFEEIKHSDLAEGRPRTIGDAASVSSWTVVKDNDRNSIHACGDRTSESSITMLESDNHELITRLTEMQRKNSELQERVNLLEETNGAMAEDLINKASVIQQFLKEKTVTGHMCSPASPEKLPPGLRKVIDLMKIDQSAAEIRDMNKRLQRMLEETLTKNMHLQKDLEVMSEEVARLTSSGDEKHH